jgi:hypothetical protein
MTAPNKGFYVTLEGRTLLGQAIMRSELDVLHKTRSYAHIFKLLVEIMGPKHGFKPFTLNTHFEEKVRQLIKLATEYARCLERQALNAPQTHTQQQAWEEDYAEKTVDVVLAEIRSKLCEGHPELLQVRADGVFKSLGNHFWDQKKTEKASKEAKAAASSKLDAQGAAAMSSAGGARVNTEADGGASTTVPAASGGSSARNLPNERDLDHLRTLLHGLFRESVNLDVLDLLEKFQNYEPCYKHYTIDQLYALMDVLEMNSEFLVRGSGCSEPDTVHKCGADEDEAMFSDLQPPAFDSHNEFDDVGFFFTD